MPASYDVTKFVLLDNLKASATRAKTAVDAVDVKASAAIKSANVVSNAINLYTSTDCTGTAAFSLDFPSELVLDQLHTTFVPNFAWSSATYAGSTNPNLEGKPVLVIAVKDTNAAGTVTTTYSFLNMESLVDVYTIALGDSAKVLTINGNVITFHVSSAANNAITVQNDGLHVDISGKADKDTDAVAGNIAVFDANGNPVDSGKAIATSAEVTAMLDEVWGASA